MAVIKVFDSNGVKTLILAGGLVSDQEYDTVEEEDIEASEDSEASD